MRADHDRSLVLVWVEEGGLRRVGLDARLEGIRGHPAAVGRTGIAAAVAVGDTAGEDILVGEVEPTVLAISSWCSAVFEVSQTYAILVVLRLWRRRTVTVAGLGRGLRRWVVGLRRRLAFDG